LFVKILSLQPSKTIFIREIDEELWPTDEFGEYLVESDADIERICEGKGSALFPLTDPDARIRKFKQLKDGEKYDVFTRYRRFYR
jgi:hypothetical protein